MLRTLLPRLVLFLLPFAVWWAWSQVARRTGRPMGSTPWAWLFAGGSVLVALSLMASVAFQVDNRSETYVPAEAGTDGRVQPGRFEKR